MHIKKVNLTLFKFDVILFMNDNLILLTYVTDNNIILVIIINKDRDETNQKYSSERSDL